MREGAMLLIMHPLAQLARGGIGWPLAVGPGDAPSSRMTFTFLVIAMSLLVIAEIALNHRQQSRGIGEARRERQQLTQFPSISVIRPVRGADVGAEENYAAALNNGYPGEI